MALTKGIRQADGVTTSYHRVLYVTIATNSHNSIAVCSYVDEQSRREDDAAGSGEARPYRRAVTYETGYDQSMTVEGAYAWLKGNVDAFSGAEDVLE